MDLEDLFEEFEGFEFEEFETFLVCEENVSLTQTACIFYTNMPLDYDYSIYIEGDNNVSYYSTE